MWLPLGNFGVMQGNLAGRDWLIQAIQHGRYGLPIDRSFVLHLVEAIHRGYALSI